MLHPADNIELILPCKGAGGICMISYFTISVVLDGSFYLLTTLRVLLLVLLDRGNDCFLFEHPLKKLLLPLGFEVDYTPSVGSCSRLGYREASTLDSLFKLSSSWFIIAACSSVGKRYSSGGSFDSISITLLLMILLTEC